LHQKENAVPFKVQVGPPQIAIHQGQTVLVCASDGQINWPSDLVLYFLDSHLISAWAVYASGEPWELLNHGAITYYAARIFLTNRGFLTEDGAVPARSLSLVLGILEGRDYYLRHVWHRKSVRTFKAIGSSIPYMAVRITRSPSRIPVSFSWPNQGSAVGAGC
jgi:hypothetical protein